MTSEEGTGTIASRMPHRSTTGLSRSEHGSGSSAGRLSLRLVGVFVRRLCLLRLLPKLVAKISAIFWSLKILEMTKA